MMSAPDVFLTGNQLSAVTKAQFFGLVSLTHLRFPLNNIRELEAHLLEAMPHLTHFNLQQNNGMVEMCTDFLSENVTLRVLSLGYNKLHHISPDVFYKILHVPQVFLQDNALMFDQSAYQATTCNQANSTATTTTKCPAPTIQKFHFHGNKQKLLGKDLFLPPMSLIYLDLSHNKITAIHKHAFNGLLNLVELHLWENKAGLCVRVK